MGVGSGPGEPWFILIPTYVPVSLNPAPSRLLGTLLQPLVFLYCAVMQKKKSCLLLLHESSQSQKCAWKISFLQGAVKCGDAVDHKAQRKHFL